jgi:NAD(P)-dependent dehydrogenase (short-subunit alcohol dehydrogenase family)
MDTIHCVCNTTGQPAELAPSYVFYASQDSSYITADVMAVTGGRSIV